MSVARKYTFDTEFGSGGKIIRAPEKEKKHFSAEEVETARAEGREEGEASAMAAAQQQTAAAVAAVGEQLAAIHARLDSESQTLRREAVDLALTAARTIADGALSRFPEAPILAVFKDLAELLRAEPRINISLGGDAEAVRACLETAARDAGCDGAVVVTENAEGAPGDAVIRWSAGAVEQTLAERLAAVRAAAERWLHAEAAGEQPSGDAGVTQLSLFDALDGEAADHG